jgi:hypothetical protein
MIPLSFIEPKAGYPIYRLKLDRLQQLLPGASPGLDTICEGILSKAPFVLRDKHLRVKLDAVDERSGVDDRMARAHQPVSGG